MPDPIKLSEQNRAKLDGIVQQMVSNKEPDENIKFVVEDFKNKYAEKKKNLRFLLLLRLLQIRFRMEEQLRWIYQRVKAFLR